MKAKTFDCVDMKRKAAERIYEETKDLSLEERQAYWREKSDLFLKKQQERKSAVEECPK